MQAGRLIEPWFFFALVWSVGGTCDGQKFDRFLRSRMMQEKMGWGGGCYGAGV